MKTPSYLHFTTQPALPGRATRRVAKYLFGTVLVLLVAISGDALAEPVGLLSALESPLALRGDEHTACRHPLVFREGDPYHLFCSFVREEGDHLIYRYVAFGKSKDLVD